MSSARSAGDLLERDGQLAALAGVVEAARSGSGRLLLLDGAAGLGKSRLLEAATEIANGSGALMLEARGEELERSRPWAVVRQLFGPALALREAVMSLSDVAGPAARLLDDAAGEVAPSFEDPMPLLHALSWLTADLATDQTLLLAIDDAHWADEPSLRFVRYLLPRLGDLPVAVVLARRPGQRGADRIELESIAGDRRCVTLELRPLSHAAAGELVRAQLGPDVDPKLVDACAEVSGGNPFYLRELLLELHASRTGGASLSVASVRGVTPVSITRTVFLRLSRLGAEAAALARAVSILGDRASFPAAAELAGLEHERASAALDALAAGEILAPGEPLSFVHPLVADAVHSDIPAGERGDLHRLAARLLDRDGAAPEDLASQLLLAGRRADPWTVEVLRSAARQALSKGAVPAAASYLTRALEEPPTAECRGALITELAHAEGVLGSPRAPERFQAALELASDPSERAQLQLALGRVLALRGQHHEAAEAFDAGSNELRDPGSELARELRAAWWMSARVIAHQKLTLPHAELELDGHQSPTPAQRQLLAQFALQRAFESAHRGEVRELAERAWGDGALLEAETSDGLAWSLVTAALLLADELEREVEVCDAVLADARSRGSPMAFATVSYCRAFPLLYQGRVDQAVADVQAAVDAREDGWSAFLGAAASGLALGQLERGSIEDARRALALVEDDPSIQASLEYLLVLAARGSLLLAEGRPAEGLDCLLRIGGISAAAGIDFSGGFAWQSSAAIAASVGGDQALGAKLAAEALAHAQRLGAPRGIAHAQRACGYAARGEAAIEHFHAAVRTLARSHPRLQHGYALVDLGAALRRARRRAEAREYLTAGLAFATSGGAHALAERARTELAAAGARTAAHTGTGLASLTPSERRVAELAAAGQSNRAIAHSLFVTVKAVEYHLANVYRKLHISGRGELAPLLAPSDGGG